MTVYLNTAQIKRTATVNIPAGESTLIFEKLSAALYTNSLQVLGKGDFTILSVVKEKSVTEKEVEQLDTDKQAILDQLKALSKQQKEFQDALTILQKEEAFLAKNENIISPHRPGSVEELSRANDYFKTRLKEIFSERVRINDELQKIKESTSILNQQLNDLDKKTIDTRMQAIVKVYSKSASKGTFEIDYLVQGARWYPTYDIRVKNIDDPIDLLFKANITQNTDEDWENVDLTLSTGDPTEGGVKPELSPYILQLNSYRRSRGHVGGYYENRTNQSGAYTGQISGTVYDADYNEPLIGVSIQVKGTTVGTATDINGQFNLTLPAGAKEIVVSYIGYETQSIPIQGNRIDVRMSGNTMLLDEVVVMSGKRGGRSKKKVKSSKNAEYSQTIEYELDQKPTVFEYKIERPYSIPANGKLTTIDIKHFDLSADFEYASVPKLDKDAFLFAGIPNWDEYSLLAGEASLFFEGKFLGKTILETQGIGDTLNISLGRDKNIVLERTKVKDYNKKQFLGTKKTISKAWEIVVQNNKKQAIEIKIEDQIPISKNSEIEVSHEELSGGKLDEDTGIVTWKIKLEPKEKKKLLLKYSAKMPKKYSVRLE